MKMFNVSARKRGSDARVAIDTEHNWHDQAARWFSDDCDTGWATCPLTENGCIRIMSRPGYPTLYHIAQVCRSLRETTGLSDHVFWPDGISIASSTLIDHSRLGGHQQITDVYLLALAVANHGRLVTFDRSIQRDAVVGCRDEHLTVL